MNNYVNSSAVNIRLPLILLLALLTALDAMAIDMYLPGMPDIAADLNVGAGRIQQTLAVFLAGLAIGQGCYGPFLDRFGRRGPLLTGIAIFVAGSVLGAVATSVEWLLLARFIQAVGASAGLVTPRAIVADKCTLDESSRILSLLMQVMMIGPVLAPLIGGYLLGHGGWRFIFWVLAGLGALCLIWAARILPDSLPIEQRSPIKPAAVVRSYCLQLRNSAFMSYTISGGFVLSALFVYISSSAFIFTQFYGFTAAQFSYIFAGNSIGLIAGGFISNMLLSRGLGTRTVLLAGLLIHTSAALVLFIFVKTGTPDVHVYAGLLALSVAALGLIFGNLTALTMNNAGSQVGTASALMGMLQYLISAAVGYVVTLFAQEPGLMPLSITICGALALLFRRFADRAARENAGSTVCDESV
ncbi:multidrug effflux MFS transporter [Leclercia adecarboxylata]|uniref:multidrug effflux MFS transporter n=1 Tax=Leclercia adecarboxylata TaxID=83655 RepID=UPI002DB7B246|nr:multidrug effflux MFS transporter [Leclercia adecarboxylata]MEB6377749.1 multidrug effflux MFS transporter [Leclercia adecarboxylata]